MTISKAEYHAAMAAFSLSRYVKRVQAMLVILDENPNGFVDEPTGRIVPHEEIVRKFRQNLEELDGLPEEEEAQLLSRIAQYRLDNPDWRDSDRAAGKAEGGGDSDVSSEHSDRRGGSEGAPGGGPGAVGGGGA